MDAETVQKIVDLNSSPIQVELGAERRIVFLPNGNGGYTVQDISQYLSPPSRIKQKVELLNVDSLIAYTMKFKGEATAIFADEGAATYDVVLDYHGEAGKRGERDHTARYACPKSEQWTIWTTGDSANRQMNQTKFAQFIEANLVDVVEPISAEMLEIVNSLQVHKQAKFHSDIVIQNGQTQIGYSEEIRGSAKAGSVVIPNSFVLGIPVFVDGPRYRIEARFRYRLEDEGKLVLWYELIRPLEAFRAAIKDVSAEVRKGLPGVPFWIGKRQA